MYSFERARTPKGARRVLKERPERDLVLEYPTTQNGLGCVPEGGCCTLRVLEAARGLRDQKCLQEEVEVLSHCVLFYPNFTARQALPSVRSVEHNELQGDRKSVV